jgi:predicted nucleic-acid-binding Zn-ribbon protein
MEKTEMKPKTQLEKNATSSTRCGKCGGQMKEASFEILNSLSIDFGHALLVGPKKFFYLNPNRRSPILVMVCSKCGYIECYAEYPEGL